MSMPDCDNWPPRECDKQLPEGCADPSRPASLEGPRAFGEFLVSRVFRGLFAETYEWPDILLEDLLDAEFVDEPPHCFMCSPRLYFETSPIDCPCHSGGPCFCLCPRPRN